MADITGYIDIIRQSTSGENVRDAIINCMNDINRDAAIKVTTGKMDTVTIEPGTHYTQTIKTPAGYAYSQFTVDVKAKSADSSSTEVAVITDDIVIDNDTPNGKVAVESGHQIGSVTVNIDNLYRSSEIADNITIAVDNLDEMMGFSALTQGYTAMKRLTITGAAASSIAAATGGTVGPGGVTYYPVKFYADTKKSKLIQQVSVPKGGSALSYLNVKASDIVYDDDSLEWIGWTPDPYYVTKAMDCIPKFAEPAAYAGEIEDSWETIVQNPSKYAIGDYKTMVVNATVPANRLISVSAVKYNNKDKYTTDDLYMVLKNTREATINTSYKMMLVDKGSYTTWMSMSRLGNVGPLWDNSSGYWSRGSFLNDENDVADGYYTSGGVDDYSTSHARHFLNNFLFTIIPSVLRNNIKTVKKRYYGLANPQNMRISNLNNDTVIMKSTDEKIWLPSPSELHTLLNYGVVNKHVQMNGTTRILYPTIDAIYTMDTQQTDLTANTIVRNAIIENVFASTSNNYIGVRGMCITNGSYQKYSIMGAKRVGSDLSALSLTQGNDNILNYNSACHTIFCFCL